jgi:outer membrane lipoprotein-sorting protein
VVVKCPEPPRTRVAMASKVKDCNMDLQRTRGSAARGSAARGYATLGRLVLAAATVVLGGCTRSRPNSFLAPTSLAVPSGVETAPPSASRDDVETLLKRMEAAYDEVKDYQTDVEILLFKEDGSFKTEKSLYTFKKPKWIRLDFVSPHPGMVLVYPDPDGKVLMRPQGALSILTSHLALNDPLLGTPSGQRLDQTDLGVLIKNIRHSVTDQRRGPVSLSENKEAIRIQVLADDHFREGVESRYQFLISKGLWLPVEVGEATTQGVQEGRIIFRNLRTNINVPDELFQ